MSSPFPEAKRTQEASRQFLTVTLLLTLAGLLLRVLRLDAQSLWIDEGLSIAWIDEIETRGWATLLENIHGPLHAASIYLTSRISMDEWWLRFPSVVTGTLAIPALAYLGLRLWNARIGLSAAALLSLSPFALYYAQECRNYSYTILFASLTTAAAWAFVQRPRVRHALALAGCELLGILSNLNGLFLALGLNLWMLHALRRNRRGLALWLGVHVLVALLLAPYALQVNRQVRPERMVGVETDFGEKEPLRGQTTLHPLALPYALFAFSAGYSLGATLEDLRINPAAAVQPEHLPGLALVGIGFGLPFLLGLMRRDRFAAAVPLLVAGGVVTGMTLWLAATNVKPFNVRYLSVLLPFFFLFVARGLWRLAPRWRLILAGVATIVSLWSSYNYHFVPRYARDDTRGVVVFLRERATPNDIVLHFNLDVPLRYYDRLQQRIVWGRHDAGESATRARDYVHELTQGAGPVIWYLECRPEAHDPERHLLRALRAAAGAHDVYPFAGIRLHRLVLEGS